MNHLLAANYAKSANNLLSFLKMQQFAIFAPFAFFAANQLLPAQVSKALFLQLHNVVHADRNDPGEIQQIILRPAK